MTHLHLRAAASLCAALAVPPAPGQSGPLITEFMTDNESVLLDADQEYSDWIELHNPGASAINLDGWYLTDNALDLAGWRLPAVTLQPGAFLVVFASGKDRSNPAQQLHTDFSLDAAGEYLALVRPDGVTVEQDFGLVYPSIPEDESYGFAFQSQSLVAPGATARYRIPADGSLGATWTQSGFDAASWGSGPTGIGFGMVVPGLTVKEARGSVAITNLATADSVLNGTNQLQQDIRIRPKINLLGTGSDGRYGLNDAFALGGEDFCLRATGTIMIPTSGIWTFMTNSDDGARVRIDGLDVLVDDVLAGPHDRLASTSLVAGPHTIELTYFERGGGDEIELAAALGSHSQWLGNFKLIGDTAAGGLEVFTTPEGSTGGQGIQATDISAPMRNINPGAFVRVPFSVTDPAAVETLSLRMRWNDGFVAYLNGVEIARRNAPAVTPYNAVATASRTLAESLAAESINVTAFHPGLVAGPNVLAIHGLNISAADSTFLVMPELIGGSLESTGLFYFKQATPGGLNGTPASLGPVADTEFSPKRGFFTAPIDVSIASATPDATIRFTTDGSVPTVSTGTVYTGPLHLTATTVLRAAAFKTGYDPTNADTNTYIFLDDVLQQSPTGVAPPGWPPAGNSVNNQLFNYGMDPDVVTGREAEIKQALTAIPTLSLALNQNDFSGPQGVYTNSGQHGFAFERPCSLEMINDVYGDGGGFQENAGLRIRGGFSRDPNNPKHAFRIFFRSEYGVGTLDYPIFQNEGVDEFDSFDIQTSQNYSWAYQNSAANNFLRELWSRDSSRDTGQPYTRGRFYHLYINGQYWGLYQIEERPEAAFGSSYLGGNKGDYDVIKHTGSPGGYTTEFTDGNFSAWQDLWNKSRASYFINTNREPGPGHAAHVYTTEEKNAAFFKMMGLAADGVTPTADPVLLDVDNLADYMLVVFMSGNSDSPLTGGGTNPNNFFSIRDRAGPRGFFHIQHDAEHSLNTGSGDRTGPFSDPLTGSWAQFPYSNPQYLHQDLSVNPEYRVRFGDRVRRHLYNGGALTESMNQARLASRAAVVESAIVAESARWGDAKKTTAEAPFTKDTWISAKNATLGWFAGRTSTVINQLRADGLYPVLEAPTFNQHGGFIAGTTVLGMAANSPTIYYTVNGSDPRLIGGALNPAAAEFIGGITTTTTLLPAGSLWRYHNLGQNLDTAWREAGFNDGGWASGLAELGSGDAAEGRPEATVINIGPTGARYSTIYFRTTFTVTGTPDFDALNLEVMRDDGAVAYLNGVEVFRHNMPAPPAVISYATPALANVAALDEATFYPQAVPTARLVPGLNTLAVEVHQSNPSSGDLSFDARLTGMKTSFADPLFLPTGVADVKARVRDASGNWSALNTAEFLVDTARAAAGNIVISEIHYHPANPSPAEIAAGFFDDSDFEFIELMNTGPYHADLRRVSFTNGIQFNFSSSTAGTLLAPGARVVVVHNEAAFRLRYGNGPVIAGTFTGSLNNAGEGVAMAAADQTAILDFSYDDSAPWATNADGDGFSLVLVNPAGNPDPSSPDSWRSSAIAHGSPGASDGTTYAAWKSAHGLTGDSDDADGDGLTNFDEYVYGGSPSSSSVGHLASSSVETMFVAGALGDVLTVTVIRRLAADDVDFALETSSELAGWSAAGMERVSETNHGDGTATIVYRSLSALPDIDRIYVRARAELRAP